ncbi:hypothetical protein EMPS_10457 [Entomortierella parvispora]|uniref:Uncharacterized protein n=1 Tax=Entomortierella parvispora TaxID=205924 RepID=A0A9P3M1A6_9FUNG|nr:hypothetical protein EMPS_10457 [Entomortierella parvispora]
MVQTQFHHYIPRFILKTFADNFSLSNSGFTLDTTGPYPSSFKEGKPSKLRRKERPRYAINVYRVKDLTSSLVDVSKVYGVDDMYRDVNEADCMKFEKLLGRHECASAAFIRQMWDKDQDLSLTRA